MEIKRSVVVLDDCETDQLLLRRAIDETHWFSQVEQFVDPREALAFFLSQKISNTSTAIDLLLLDFRMPHFNGVQFLQQVRTCKLGELIKNVAVMMTVPLLQCDANAFRNAHQHVHFLVKPLQRDALGSIIGATEGKPLHAVS
ncbi:MAG: response regulator [Hyphomicrobiales bacterium]|jgi:CheY-like chemotaxis protein